LALFWFVGVLGFFTVAATKYFSYTLPLMPAASILVALWWGDRIAHSKRYSWGLYLTVLSNIVLFLAFAAACFYSPHWLNDDPSMPNLGLRLQQSALPIIGTIVWLGSAIAGIIVMLQRKSARLWGVNLVGFIAFLIFVVIPGLHLVDLERQLPLRQIAQAAVQAARPGEELVMLSRGFPKPSLVFYTQKHVTYLLNPFEALPYIERSIGQDSNTKSVLFVASTKMLSRTGLTPNQYQEISSSGIYHLLRVGKEAENL
jgi:4-amino-4-deoxy-L-arabinose transferase-like glycosyltransferase